MEMWCSKCRMSFSQLEEQADNPHSLPECICGGGHNFTNECPAEAALITHPSPYLVQ